MTLHAEARASVTVRRIALAPWALPLTLVLMLALAVPMFVSSPANLTSDESLYLAEAYNIAHGHGATYPSGEAITHRAPLYPALLAPAVALGGPDAAYAASKLIVALDALLVLLLAWRIGGALAGGIAGVLAAASAYLTGLATTLYLDPLECAFLLLTLLALHEATRDRRMRWWIAGGLSLGLAFLVKESAVQWAPLGVAAWLAVPVLRNRAGARGAFAFTAMFALAVAPWWIWVYAHDGDLFMLGALSPARGAMLAFALTSLAAFGVAAARLPAPRRAFAMPAAVVLIAAWGAFMLYGLTVYSTWPFPSDFARTIPAYLRTVAPQAQPYFLLAAAWVWAALTARRDGAVRLIVVAALLFLPFALFTANRNLQLRDVLPLVYVSYVLLGVAAARVLHSVRRMISDPVGEAVMFAALVFALGGFALQQVQAFRDDNAQAAALGVRADNWDSPFVRDSAAWIDANLPAGSHILSNRLYFSSLYVATEGRYEIRQLPTVRVDVDPARQPLLEPASNLFRWGDGDLRASEAGDQWLYLKQFPGKGYWAGMTQQELYAYVESHDAGYLVLTGDDVVFSTLSIAAFLTSHPAFRLIHWQRATAGDQFLVYAIDRDQLAPRPSAMAISPANLDALTRETGLTSAALEQALGQPIHVTDTNWGLSEPEQWAALAETAP